MKSTSKKKILIVEDDYHIQLIYKLKLDKAGYDVGVAYNGVDGLKVAEKLKPDLILLDIMMPEMGGDEMLEKLRGKTWGEEIKVLVLTNVSKSEIPISMRKHNVSNYLIKAQYTPTQVLNVIKATLED